MASPDFFSGRSYWRSYGNCLRPGYRTPRISKDLSAASRDHAIERYRPVEPADFFTKTVRSQEISHPSVRSHNAEGDSAGAEFPIQIVQHARACKVNVGRGRQITDDEANSRAGRAKPGQNTFKHRFGIDINQRRFRTKGDRALQGLIVGVPVHVGIGGGTRNTAQ